MQYPNNPFLASGAPNDPYLTQGLPNMPYAGGGLTAYDSAVLADSPTFYLPNSLSDVGSGHHSMTGHGGLTTAQAGPGSQGNCAFGFNGTDAYITTPDNANLVAATVTYETFILVPNLSNFWFLICRSGGQTSNSPAQEFRIENATGAINFLLQPGGSAVSAGAVTTLSWQHIAVTLSGGAGSSILYLNGSVIQTNPGIAINTAVGDNLYIGTRPDFFDFLPTGSFIAKPAIYLTALSAARIAAHYAAR